MFGRMVIMSGEWARGSGTGGVRATALDVDPSRAGDVEPVTQGGDGGLERGGGIALRLAGGVERGDLREDGLKASSCELGHRAFEGEDATGEGHGFGVWVSCVGHGEKLEAVDDVQQVRAVSQGEDVQGQRKASEEGEEEFHGLGV